MPTQTVRHMAQAKLLVMAPNITQSHGTSTNALELVGKALQAARIASVPVVFALSRRGIGQVGAAPSMHIALSLQGGAIDAHRLSPVRPLRSLPTLLDSTPTRHQPCTPHAPPTCANARRGRGES